MPPKSEPGRTEKDWAASGKSGWKHPYVIYVLLVLAIFFGLLIGAYLAITQGWIPQRI